MQKGSSLPRYVFDLETNGLIPELDRLQCLCMKDIDTGFVWSGTDYPYETKHPNAQVIPIEEGLRLLMASDLVVGHDIIKFDILDLEDVRIVIRAPLNVDVGEYSYTRKAAGTASIAEGLEQRVLPIVGDFSVAVVGGQGVSPNRRIRMSTIRETYVQ